ncbi:hypothetical protein BU23DRAFT_626639 [Bimuria novae-zelandiae CBS 107.79]|uniref:RING-type domain-containing protein n=1 Tax=Bimuria novae-zelandiae CBS 107.79 TaxID=1447943 RepID=A0A6A5VUR3_9PLEO|nr:hypothetical protein BU23DRAFT_626639 [Bimuria novae-zelandiae CBS 107.79]
MASALSLTSVLGWGAYDDDHPAVKVLPCHHVFGEGCVPQFTDAMGGHQCLICRTQLFRPPTAVAFMRLAMSWHDPMMQFLLSCEVKYYALPRLSQDVLAVTGMWLASLTIPYYMTKAAKASTALQSRIPNFSFSYYVYLLGAQNSLALMLWSCIRRAIRSPGIMAVILGPLVGEPFDAPGVPAKGIFPSISGERIETDTAPSVRLSQELPVYNIIVPLQTALAVYSIWRVAVKGGKTTTHGVQDPIKNRSDKAMFAVILFVEAVLLRTCDFWTIICAYCSRDPWDGWAGAALSMSQKRWMEPIFVLLSFLFEPFEALLHEAMIL